jgi:hypothetical protein
MSTLTQINALTTLIEELGSTSAATIAEHAVHSGWVLLPATKEEIPEFLSDGVSHEARVRLEVFLAANAEAAEALRKEQAASERKPLKSYKPKDFVSIMVPALGVWVPGRVNSVDPVSGYLHVDTERGPVTIASNRRVRLQ